MTMPLKICLSHVTQQKRGSSFFFDCIWSTRSHWTRRLSCSFSFFSCFFLVAQLIWVANAEFGSLEVKIL